eukprot:scaffold15157_cov90-Isochrysis_galbana.AAC.1
MLKSILSVPPCRYPLTAPHRPVGLLLRLVLPLRSGHALVTLRRRAPHPRLAHLPWPVGGDRLPTVIRWLPRPAALRAARARLPGQPALLCQLRAGRLRPGYPRRRRRHRPAWPRHRVFPPAQTRLAQPNLGERPPSVAHSDPAAAVPDL